MTVTVTDDEGAVGVSTQSVTVVVPPNQAPVASFTYEADYLDVEFDASGSSDPDGSIASVSWDFGDDSAAVTGEKVSHTYAAAGSYQVTVTVTDDEGAVGVSTQSVTVVVPPNQAPVASFTYEADYLDVEFDASGSSDPDGSIASVSWDFGDDSAAVTGEKVSHTYAAEGSYQVTVTVTDDDGVSSTAQQWVTVAAVPVNQAPVASFTYEADYLDVEFDASGSSDPDGSIASVSWDFGDDSAAVTGEKVSHTYAAAGEYQVTVTVTDDEGAVGVSTQSVTVVVPPNQAPVASFTYEADYLDVEFDASGSSDPDGSIASVSWDFGDDSAAVTGEKVSHTYAAAGEYQVTVTVTDDEGAVGVSTQPVVVSDQPANQPPSASFTHSVAGLKASFDASGSSDPDGSIASVSWDFGDNSAAVTGEKVSHTYAAAGTYPVTVTVTDNGGASSTSTSSVTVTEPVGEPVTTRVVNSGSSWSYLYQLSAPPTDWAQRTFSDVAWSTGAGPIGYGSSVVGTNLNPPAVATDRPRAAYARTTFEVLDSAAVTALSLSVLADDGAVVYVNGVEVGRDNLGSGAVTYLTFADSARRVTAAQASPLVVSVPVSLLVDGINVIAVESHVNYRSTPDLTIAVTADLTTMEPGNGTPNIAPSASFTHSVAGLKASFDASGSSDPDGSIASVSWDFGDNSAAVTGEKVSHTYAAAGTYPVTVTVTDNGGASSTSTSSVTVTEPVGEPVTTRVVNSGSSWSYLYQLSAPPTDWAQRTFSDVAWSTGAGPIGYGSSVVGTNLNPPAVATDRPRAAYARTTFEVLDSAAVTALSLSVLADDGAVVYVNGVEVGRDNLGSGAVTYLTFADSARRVTAAQASPLVVSVPVSLLVDGINVIAVESHVNYRSTPDLTIAVTADLTVVS
ncbi:MAG: PKD domain-containing protein [Tessaracoccus sp.]|uniref:PKD domain-containing protein n=1 Tax=Tessaracoccus sp. TaxID=1971211 RepID=UPI001EC4C3D0|nr:PKD domain-containing protein [Tessaracoccus sp.]MBK7822198.1 PKD domain-containing protein [Tessaracoccus sp.]